MIKKHLIACSGMLVLMVGAKLFIYSTPTKYREFYSNFDNLSVQSPSGFLISSTSFANEPMPFDNPKFIKKIKKELKNHSYEHLQTKSLHENAEKWFPVIEPILKLYGIPEDFKYLPLVESGLKRGTSSYRGASGYWQFMPGTARTYGLRVGSNIDERQDIRKSTTAACKYMSSLFKEFKSWTLVAAAYNTGEDKLHAQIDRQNESDYFKMKLNSETASFVYKLISMKEIIENPVKNGYVNKSGPFIFARNEQRNTNYIVPVLKGDELVKGQFIQN